VITHGRTSYTELQATESPVVLTMCNSCGSIVGDTDLHDVHHNRMTDMSQRANQAFDGAYPQGGGWY
jgi:hypothetical protein